MDSSSDLNDSDDDDEPVFVESSDMAVEAADVHAILSDNSFESSFLPKHMRCG